VVNRHEHVADILLSTDLNGFAHHELALVSAIVRRAGDRHADVISLGPSATPLSPDRWIAPRSSWRWPTRSRPGARTGPDCGRLQDRPQRHAVQSRCCNRGS
jgi:hypothetical protein